MIGRLQIQEFIAHEKCFTQDGFMPVINDLNI